MKKIITALLLLIIFNASAQQEQRTWIFGHNTNTTGTITPGNMQFPGGTGTPGRMLPQEPAINSNGIFGYEGTAVATDPSTGALLFYSDGRYVYNSQHQLLDIDPTTSGVFENLGASSSCTQPVALSVVPVCPFNQFYIFSNPTGTVSYSNGDYSDGPITYRTYNTTNGTFGPSQNLPNIGGTQNADEGMVVIPSRTDPYTYWLIYRLHNPVDINGDAVADNNVHVVYRISSTGITFQTASSFGPSISSSNGRYTLNISAAPSQANANNYRLGFASSTKDIYTIDFNTTTGTFVGTASIITNSSTSVTGTIYDIEFSPNGNFLYIGTYYPSVLYQVNLTTTTAAISNLNTNNLIKNYTPTDTYHRGGGLKLGPDGKIYHMQDGGDIANTTNPSVIVGSINTPNVAYNSANYATFYKENAFTYTNLTGYNFPEFVRTPLWNATVQISNGDEFICENESVNITSVINSMGVAITGYQWQKSDDPTVATGWSNISGATSSSYTASTSGYYRLRVNLTGGCFIYSNIIRISRPPAICMCNNTFKYKYTTNTTISEPTVWEGKVSIADNVTITVNSSLDITNVDVIFGSCANIKFNTSGSLRANNSVFRPCDKNGTWGGLVFLSSKNNLINECTFKNAICATYFTSNAEATISNNLFQNNSRPVYINSSIFTTSITGNQFEINKDFPFTSTVSCSNGFVMNGSANNTSFIYINYGTLSGQVAQNNFANNHPGTPTVIGIEAYRLEDIEIIDNSFSNIVNAIKINNNSGCCPQSDYNDQEVFISGNRIVIDRQANTGNIIDLSSLDKVTISNNEIINTVNDVKANIPGYGLMVGYTSKLNFKNNTISGVLKGVHAGYISNSQFVDNRLINIYEQGISLINFGSVNVACNTIDLNYFKGTGKAAVGVVIANPSSDVKIHSNCITDCSNPIYISGSSSNTLPLIQNNFLYNYATYGIYINGVNGTIGSSTAPGTNTFYSNSNAVDLAAVSATVNAYDNYNLKTISGAAILSNNQYYSTASCAMQTIGTPSQSNLNKNLVCDEKDYLFALPSVNLKTGAVQEQEIVYENTGNILDVSTNGLNVYPNPTSERLTIKLVTTDNNINASTLQVVDLAGRVLKEVVPQIVGGEMSLLVDDLQAGLYMVRFTSSAGENHSSIFVKK